MLDGMAPFLLALKSFANSKQEKGGEEERMT